MDIHTLSYIDNELYVGIIVVVRSARDLLESVTARLPALLALVLIDLLQHIDLPF